MSGRGMLNANPSDCRTDDGARLNRRARPRGAWKRSVQKSGNHNPNWRWRRGRSGYLCTLAVTAFWTPFAWQSHDCREEPTRCRRFAISQSTLQRRSKRWHRAWTVSQRYRARTIVREQGSEIRDDEVYLDRQHGF